MKSAASGDPRLELGLDAPDDETDTEEALEDGLSMIDDEELIGSGSEDYSEED